MRRPTAHELEVLAVVLDSGSAKAAAGRLGLAEATVKRILTGVRVKVGAVNTTQAVWALRHELEGLVQPACDAGPAGPS